MAERFFDAAGKIISQEIDASVAKGKGYFDKATKAPGALAYQLGRLTDVPGYLYRDSGWMRVTRYSEGFSVVDLYQAGVRPGQISKLRATLRGLIR